MREKNEDNFEEFFQEDLSDSIMKLKTERQKAFQAKIRGSKEAYETEVKSIRDKINMAIREVLTIEDRWKLQVLLSERRYSTDLQKTVYRILDGMNVQPSLLLLKVNVDKIKSEFKESQESVSKVNRLTISDRHLKRLLKQYILDKQ